MAVEKQTYKFLIGHCNLHGLKCPGKSKQFSHFFWVEVMSNPFPRQMTFNSSQKYPELHSFGD